MVSLVTYVEVEAELAATAAYDVTTDVSLAQRRVAALRRKLDFAEASDENGRKVEFNHIVVQKQLDQVVEWVRNNAVLSDAAKLNDPSVIHADFSMFRSYQ